MIPKNRPPTTPGEILLEEFLKPLGLSQVAFAARLGLSAKHVNAIIHGRRAVTAETARLLARALKTTAQFWMNAQAATDLYEARKRGRRVRAAAPEDATVRGQDVFAERYVRLLARRIPLDAIVLGRAYVIHARNGGVGVAVRDQNDGWVGYCLHRVKWGEHFLFTEVDWAEDPRFGTAIPLVALDDVPPKKDKQLLAWLTAREADHRSEIDAAWKLILGKLFVERR